MHSHEAGAAGLVEQARLLPGCAAKHSVRIVRTQRSAYAFARVHLLGLTHHPIAAWTIHQARNLLMGPRMPLRFVIRGPKYTTAFDALFESDRATVIKTPPQAPRTNAICERWISTLRHECIDRMLIYNERHLRQKILRHYIAHYNEHRPHRALHRRPPIPPTPAQLAGTLWGSNTPRES